MTKEFKEFINNYIEDELISWEGSTVYGSELWYDLTETIDMNNGYFNSYDEAFDFVKKYLSDASDAYEYYMLNLGECPNPFENINYYTVLMIQYGVSTQLGQSETVNSFWDNQEELTSNIIDKIIKDIKNN